MNRFGRFIPTLLAAAALVLGVQASAKPAVKADAIKLPAGHVSIKDKDFKFCRTCHGAGQGKPATLAGRLKGVQIHALSGITCTQCHGQAGPKGQVPMRTCVGCHGSTQDLAAATAKVQPRNPHQSRHYGTDADCNKCHHMHKASENDCTKCHPGFVFQTP